MQWFFSEKKRWELWKHEHLLKNKCYNNSRVRALDADAAQHQHAFR